MPRPRRVRPLLVLTAGLASAALLVKDAGLPEEPLPTQAVPPGGHPNTDRDELHDIAEGIAAAN